MECLDYGVSGWRAPMSRDIHVMGIRIMVCPDDGIQVMFGLWCARLIGHLCQGVSRWWEADVKGCSVDGLFWLWCVRVMRCGCDGVSRLRVSMSRIFQVTTEGKKTKQNKKTNKRISTNWFHMHITSKEIELESPSCFFYLSSNLSNRDFLA